jgi:hypothetical protein
MCTSIQLCYHGIHACGNAKRGMESVAVTCCRSRDCSLHNNSLSGTVVIFTMVYFCELKAGWHETEMHTNKKLVLRCALFVNEALSVSLESSKPS